ncbi:MAG: hypothetical protein WCD86_17530 [Ktedonobacteraceae bacterium]
MSAFTSYIQRHRLNMHDVARAANVRLLTVWNIDKEIPVRGDHADAVRSALYRLTGVHYAAPIAIHAPEKQPVAPWRHHEPA